MSPSVCAAETVIRRREPPVGTLGGRIAPTRYPARTGRGRSPWFGPDRRGRSGRYGPVHPLRASTRGAPGRCAGDEQPRTVESADPVRWRRWRALRGSPSRDWGCAGREDERPRPVEQMGPKGLGAGDECAGGAECLAERADRHVDRPFDTPVLGGAASIRAEHPVAWASSRRIAASNRSASGTSSARG